jgi:N-acetylmuramoyl-L-alanine amidase
MGYIKRTFSIILLVFLLFSCGKKSTLEQQIGFAEFSDIYEEPYDGTEEFSRNNRWEYLVIHCAANNRPLTTQQLLQIFRSYGWSRPGYNIFISREGKSDTLVPFNLDPFISPNEIANGVRGYNSRAIHIAYCGGVDSRLRPRDTRTIAQKQELIRHINHIRLANPNIKIVGHNFLDRGKACPSFDAAKEYSIR